jgi:epoxyqueuosine reductase QueG
MDKEYLLKITAEFCETSPTNFLSPIAETEEELAELKRLFYANGYNITNAGGSDDWEMLNRGKDNAYAGLRFFDKPIIAFGSASDPLYKRLQEPGVVGSHHALPTDWVANAKTVISIYMPHSDAIVDSNSDPVVPSMQWRYGRADGQQHLLATGALVRDAVIEAGYKAVMPYDASNYWATVGVSKDESKPIYSSNWSERHVGWVAGLGTFGLMTNFISKLGCCGRMISIITDWEALIDTKDYEGVYDYCNKCKLCFKACPVGALTDEGKSIDTCQNFIRKMTADTHPRVGCAKCMTGMPCAKSRC